MGISSSIHGASQQVIDAISTASKKTGVDFDYLVNQARTESSFRTDVKASTSSATGLYQFIDQTWLSTMSKFGSKHGLSNEANAIQQDFQGRYYVADDTVKTHIMDLRKDPNVSSLMAAEFALDNKNYLEAKTGVDATGTDLYFAHFLGASGASNFIKAMQDDPFQPAAMLLPAAARSNKNIFYNSNGSQKSLTQIYNDFQAKIGGGKKVHVADNDAIMPPNNKVALADTTYRRDVQFERMYGDVITQFVRDFPSVDGFQNNDFFSDFLMSNTSSMMQNRRIDQSLFLTLTMLDAPK